MILERVISGVSPRLRREWPEGPRGDCTRAPSVSLALDTSPVNGGGKVAANGMD